MFALVPIAAAAAAALKVFQLTFDYICIDDSDV
jgi:hypothetical protein